jgi:protein gp37
MAARMAASSRIEWTGATWNPVRGCSRVSEGCRHCYAVRIAARFSKPGEPFEGLESHTDAMVRLLDLLGISDRDLFKSRNELIAEVCALQEQKIAYVDDEKREVDRT